MLKNKFKINSFSTAKAVDDVDHDTSMMVELGSVIDNIICS